MKSVEKRTGTVDSLDVALLTALNLARELVRIREERALVEAAIPPDRLSSLIDCVEAALALGGETAA
jgi:cell division protein ZapA (FtsZ GTPase activity inhibitor)